MNRINYKTTYKPKYGRKNTFPSFPVFSLVFSPVFSLVFSPVFSLVFSLFLLFSLQTSSFATQITEITEITAVAEIIAVTEEIAEITETEETTTTISPHYHLAQQLMEGKDPIESSLSFFFHQFPNFFFLSQQNPDLDVKPEPEVSPESEELEEFEDYRAMWISYIELDARNLKTKDQFIAEIALMFAECKELGLNTVIVQVRPFGDAFYPSEIFPWSHILTGTQGVDPGYDPLALMVDLAHNMDLKIEAWINPYRVSLASGGSKAMSWDNPAQNTNLTFTVNGATYYNPALPEVQSMVIAGVEELVKGYAIDAIHLDDYFYPTTDLSIDQKDYIASGSTLSQSDWRRENVNTLVRNLYSAVKAIDPTVKVGISPQGNNDNNYNTQYSDVKLWLSTPGYVDYITPQLYWGFNYTIGGTNTTYQYYNIANTWLSFPRHDGVSLYFGLGAYRIGVGDSSATTLEEWNTGNNLSKMISALNQMDGVTGYTLFRHDSLFRNTSYPDLALQERLAIMSLYPS